ncbi:MAG TPA: hypothetical protein VK700_06605 [Steroidobacteraceae bacterium]|jgi:hypothetical protein|nr:hypothetical protein [Steroidobacteraceae bacterium]
MTVVTLRRWHSYIGLFIAPSVLFFALTGAVQLFNLHEAHGRYTPPELVEKLSSVHKDQVFAFGDHHTAGPQEDAHQDAPQDAQPPPLSTPLLKWFFLVVALGLTLSTAFGIWMGLTQIPARRTAWLLLLAGALLPAGILLV